VRWDHGVTQIVSAAAVKDGATLVEDPLVESKLILVAGLESHDLVLCWNSDGRWSVVNNDEGSRPGHRVAAAVSGSKCDWRALLAVAVVINAAWNKGWFGVHPRDGCAGSL